MFSCQFCLGECKGGGGGGGVTPIGAVSRAATGVKMRSNGQGTFWGSVKRSSSMLGTIYKALLAIKRRGRSFCACAVNRWSRVKGKNPAWSSGQGLFSTVKNLDPGRSSGHGAYGSDPPLRVAVKLRAPLPAASFQHP